ncbi:MAG: DUF938 domain-containing protein [Cyanobacteriota bacterium]|nr:DUF938 domain-containing protein [Cyanobacteriota bacterium]
MGPPSKAGWRGHGADHLNFSPACERNKEPILQVLRHWLPSPARVLEIGSGSGQHAVHFCRHLAGLHWQCSDLPAALPALAERLHLEGGEGLAPAAVLPPPIPLAVDRARDWPVGPFDAVFSANTTHIMAAECVPWLLRGAAGVLGPGGRLLLYGPFHDGGVHTAPSNASFDAHLRNLDPAMGLRDARQLIGSAASLGLTLVLEQAMPANNRMLVLEQNNIDQRS